MIPYMKARKARLRALSDSWDKKSYGPSSAMKIVQTDITAKAVTSGRLR
jgi:hypothetical protein